ncbi:PspC domain-containing protein [Robiginitalea sp. IMCC44478]|uniref:PspC domain-containing protein n=1 Tax=Robiginitalea sp. IMCC44478 TaxID=3459122 RepID=UPI004041F95B
MGNQGLRRSNNRLIGGVCAGIAEFYGWEPDRVRLVFVLLVLIGGSGLLAYLILYFVMPPPY